MNWSTKEDYILYKRQPQNSQPREVLDLKTYHWNNLVSTHCGEKCQAFNEKFIILLKKATLDTDFDRLWMNFSHTACKCSNAQQYRKILCWRSKRLVLKFKSTYERKCTYDVPAKKVPFCTRCQNDTELFKTLRRNGQDVSHFEDAYTRAGAAAAATTTTSEKNQRRTEVECFTSCLWYEWFKQQRNVRNRPEVPKISAKTSAVYTRDTTLDF